MSTGGLFRCSFVAVFPPEDLSLLNCYCCGGERGASGKIPRWLLHVAPRALPPVENDLARFTISYSLYLSDVLAGTHRELGSVFLACCPAPTRVCSGQPQATCHSLADRFIPPSFDATTCAQCPHEEPFQSVCAGV